MNETGNLDKDDWHKILRMILSVGGFLLSIIFILSGMFMLVRFWLITDFLYLFYMFSTIFIGIIFNIFSCNLFLFTEVMTNKTIWPYFWFTPITIFWSIAGVSLPLIEDGYFNKYSIIPVLYYSQAFYDSDAFNENTATDHPFARAYKNNSVFFNNQTAVICVLATLMIIQIIYWFVAIYAYVPILKEYFHYKNKTVKEL